MELPKFIFQATENLVEKPWGGEWIALLKGFRRKGIGESWEFSAHTSNTSQVLLKKQTAKLSEIFIEKKSEIMGSLAEKYKNFPLLVKIVDVSGKMEPHVHPSEKVAESLGIGDGGKVKAWLMLSGIAYIGLNKDISLDELEWILNEEEIWKKMNKFQSTAYDTFLIPPGVIHSAENARFIEIGTNSEASIGIRDEKIKKALNLKKTEDFEIKGKKGRIETEFFFAEVVDVVGKQEFNIETFNILLNLEGFAILRSEKEVAELQKGYSCLIPAATGSYSIHSERAKVLRIAPK
ncbi:MAG: type I phosphomannose isomerase catalytic subunit [Archaeoglobaceae archaeon]